MRSFIRCRQIHIRTRKMNFMKNQLPINQKTFPNCYSHDAIYNAILSSKENIDENFAVIDNVRGFGNENVKVDLEKC